MGKEIEKIALAKGHEIILKSTSQSPLTPAQLAHADVAIEFTNPHSAVKNIETCLCSSVPVVVGSTGWYNELNKVVADVKATDGAMLHATNFSIGVNLFFSFNAHIAKVMSKYAEYEPTVHEIHHTQKLDAPSGTAITTAEVVVHNFEGKHQWVHEKQHAAHELLITHERLDNVPGTHVVTYKSEIDDISLSHVAHNRKGFASGAVLAAEWLVGKKGVYTMKDVLEINY